MKVGSLITEIHADTTNFENELERAMAAIATIRVRYELSNIKAARSLTRAYKRVVEIVADQPWNEDAKEAKRLLRRAVRWLVPRAD